MNSLSYQERLVKIMEMKDAVIKAPINYFYKADKEELLSWSNTVAKNVVKRMRDNVIRSVETYPYLYGYTCPFCQRHSKPLCSDCSYGKLHGICGSYKDHPKGGQNTWSRIKFIYNNCESRPSKYDFVHILRD